MKKLVAFFGAIIMLATTGGAAMGVETGNGSESGAHYTLNIIGTGDKSADMDNNSGHRIFVPLDGAAKISLAPGDDFAVTDANGTDKDGAAFTLPDPDVDGDGVLDGTYTVYARPLGQPGGSAEMYTCAEAFTMTGYDVTRYRSSKIDPDAYCSLDIVGTDVLTRTKGKSRFTDVTDELLTLRVEITEIETGEVTELDVPLFDDAFEGYFWEYDNNGLRLTQLRFVYN